VVLATAALLGSAFCLAAVPLAPAAAATAITISGTSAGRTFDGIGAISGGGGNSRLLTDYPAAEQTQILDYLFKPGYGADLQILKAEIGGDTNSTDGSESSHMHTATTVDCTAGYEWWLMQQAKARNPAIKLYGLAWGAPGWVGGGNFWSADTIDYLVKWLGCASSHGLTIDYLGGWNERGYDVAWYEQLRAALDAHGYRHVEIVAADSDWKVAADVAADPDFADVVSAIGVHYPCQGGDGGSANGSGGAGTRGGSQTSYPVWFSRRYHPGFRHRPLRYADQHLVRRARQPVVLRCGDLVYDRPSLILSSRRPPCWVTCLNDLCKRVPSRSWSALLSSVSWAPIDSICGMNAPHRSNTPETSCSPASMI